MPSTNFYLAPPVRVIDGLTAVPIDIQQLTASVIFNAASRTAQVDASINFIVGPNAGCPIFDLRQTVSQAFLDGSSLAPASLSHHSFGGGTNAELRILNTVLPAGSSHVLRVVYTLGQPQSPGSQPLGWDPASSRLHWDFWFTDLMPARYLEMWFPSNLIFDQFASHLDIQVVNSGIDHALITNGQAIRLAQNHWTVDFPDTFTSLSPLLIIAAADRIETRQGSVTLPTGEMIHIESSQLIGTGTNLAAEEANIRAYLSGNATDIGPYTHGSRFTAFYWAGSRSMEYDGGVTTNAEALEHEVFHSWFARGVKPASQNDGWFDEGWDTYNTNPNRYQLQSFNLADPVVQLCSRNPFNRITPGTSYTDGFRFFAGLSATLGLPNLLAWMSQFYQDDPRRMLRTEDLEAYLITKSGNMALADFFDHYVYGFAPPGPGLGPDLLIRDAADDLGADPYTGPVFWNSPDLWIRNADDGGTTHQNPVSGRDNWFYTRVHNRGVGTANSFVVTFQVKPWAGTQFVYPADYLPPITAVVEFDLPPSASRTVKAKWTANLVPVAGVHACWMASVYSPGDATPPGLHVWERNNLAQKNLTLVAAAPDQIISIPVEIGSLHLAASELSRIEVRRPDHWQGIPIWLSLENVPIAKEFRFSPGPLASMLLPIPLRTPVKANFRIQIPASAKAGESLLLHLLQRDSQLKIVGGISVQLEIKGESSRNGVGASTRAKVIT